MGAQVVRHLFYAEYELRGKTLTESLNDLDSSSDDVYIVFFGSFDGSVADETQAGRRVELVFAAADGRIYHIAR